MGVMEPEKLIKSRARVRDHGEVFTPGWLVKEMCDLVGETVAAAGSRVLEPACGDGNFLEEVLRRKLEAVRRTFGVEGARAQRERFRAVTSLYGIDLLVDNVTRCRERLYEIWATTASDGRDEITGAVRFVLERNIVRGNTLKPEGDGDTPEIILTEWELPPAESAVESSSVDVRVIRRDWRFVDLFDGIPGELFFAPEPVRIFAPIDYWRVAECLK